MGLTLYIERLRDWWDELLWRSSPECREMIHARLQEHDEAMKMELNLRTLTKPLLAGVAALFVATPAVSSTGPRLTIQWDNARQDPNISRRLWVNVTWRHGEQNLVPNAGDPYVELKPGTSTRHLIWIECDGKPWKTTYRGYYFDWTKYQTQLCNQVFDVRLS